MLKHYLSYEAVLAEAERLCSRQTGAFVETYGESVEGRPLRFAFVPGRDSRVLVLTAGLHGLEVIGPAVALSFLERVTHTTPDWSVAVVPVCNPDGYTRCWESGGNASYAAMRQNARGVDLNRNFPLPKGARPSRWPYAGSGRPGAVAYRGPSPLSEPESRHLADVLTRLRPHAALSLHSFGGVLIHPPSRERSTWVAYGALARSFRRGSGRALYRRLGVPRGDRLPASWRIGCTTPSAVGPCVELHPVMDSLREGLYATNWTQRFNPRLPDARLGEMTDGVVAWFDHAKELSSLSPCRILRDDCRLVT